MNPLRAQLVEITLAWERTFGNAPFITTALSEYDAAILVGLSEAEYSNVMRGATVVQRGFDFAYKGKRYQVKGNRPSGKKGSAVTWVPKATNYDWDCLVWILYNPKFEVQEAWLWDVAAYRTEFNETTRLSPTHLRKGKLLSPKKET